MTQRRLKFGLTNLKTLWRAARSPKAFILQKLWWFDVVYPLTLALIMLSCLTYIVYTGPRQTRLALEAEESLIQNSLRILARSKSRLAGQSQNILIVNVNPLALSPLGRAPKGLLPEASAALYGSAIESLSSRGAPIIILSWDSAAHPDDHVYLAPFIQSLRRVIGKTRVFIAAPAGANFPDEIRQMATIVEDSPCDLTERMATECSYNHEWNDWVVQAMLTALGDVPAFGGTHPPWVTDQLASSFSSFLLNLNAPTSIPQVDISEVIATSRPLPSSVQLVVMGADQRGAVSGSPADEAPRRVLTAFDEPNAKIETGGTPLHIFWAMIAQMYLNHAMVYVPSGIISVAIAVAFSIGLASLLWLSETMVALGVFLIYAFTGPIFNSLAIKYLHLYLPLFDTYYFGLMTFLLAGFGKLSLEAFHRWRLEEQSRMHAHTADLKGNFISLLSHNLNTPVAKMQGMLSLLSSQPSTDDWKQDVKQAEALLTQLEFAIRSVLIASALEEGSVHHTPRSLAALIDEVASATSGLKRLGLFLKLENVSATEGDDDLSLMPLVFDTRAFTATVTVLVALFAKNLEQTHVNVSFKVMGEGEAVVVSITCDERWLQSDAVVILTSLRHQTVRRLSGRDFLSDVFAGLAVQLTKTYQGSIELSPMGRGGKIVLTLRPEPHS